MNKIQVYLEELLLPIKTLFVAISMIALGTLLGNPFINDVFRLSHPLLTTITHVLLVTGGLILSCFPYLVFVKLLYSRTDEKNIVVVGIISYLVFLIMIMFFAPRNLPANMYMPYFTFQINATVYRLANTGIIGLIGIYLIVKRIYQKPMIPRNTNFTKVFERDISRLTRSLLFSTLYGLAIAWLLPYISQGIYAVLNFVAADIGNPMSLFAYSGFERLLQLFGLHNVVRNEMWFGTLGGTWNSLENISYIGDVNIWAAQLSESVAVLGVGSTGRFTTVYYVLNIFAAPAYLSALATTVSDKKKFRRGLITVLMGTGLSLLAGVWYPLEILMLLSTPLLYIFHVFMIGFISAVLLGISTTLGFSYLGVLSAATPGNIIDLIGFSRNSIINRQILMLLLFGVLIFFIYFYVVRFYFNNIAIDMLNIGTKEDEIMDFIERVGGLDNIEKISSTPTKVTVLLRDEDNINPAGLHRQGVTKIVQTREGYNLFYGAGSYMLQKEVNKQLGAHRNELMEVEEND